MDARSEIIRVELRSRRQAAFLFLAGIGISGIVKIFGCRPHDGWRGARWGRRTQTSNGGNRDGEMYDGAAQLKGFDGCRA
jgi:hypothetical protein